MIKHLFFATNARISFDYAQANKDEYNSCIRDNRALKKIRAFKKDSCIRG